MINYANSGLYDIDSTHKELQIFFPGGTITNKDIHFEKFELEENLCSEMELKLGSCESSKVSFRIVNPFASLKGKKITVKNILNGNTSNPFQIGKYTVYSDVPSADRSYRDIVAYDAMHDILNANVAEWYNNMFQNEDTEVSLKEFRSSFLAHFGVEEEPISLVNDSIRIKKTLDGKEISGQMVITSICELNGCFGTISREGKFRYVYLTKREGGLFPSLSLYPSETLYPDGGTSSNRGVANTISTSQYRGSPSYEDYKVKKIDGIEIRPDDESAGAIIGSDNNKYVISGNFLTYGKMESELMDIAHSIFEAVSEIEYIPFSVDTVGKPFVELGDQIRVIGKTATIDSYVFRRRMSGIQTIKDNYSAQGPEYYSKNQNTTYHELIRLKGRTNYLSRTLEETLSLITDEENGLQTQIKQNADNINLAAKKKDIDGKYIISQINIAPEEISINAKHIKLEGIVTANKAFRILTDGSAEALNLSVEGEISAGILSVNTINNEEYQKTLVTNHTIYVHATDGNDDQECETDAVFQTLQGAINSIPRFMNGRTVYIELLTDVTENIRLNHFSSGRVYIYLCGHTINGNIQAYSSSHIQIFGGTKDGGGEDGNPGIIHSHVGLVYGGYTVTVSNSGTASFYIANVKIFGPDELSEGGEAGKVCLETQFGGNTYAKAISIVNSAIGFLANAGGHIYVSSSNGIADNTAFYARTGGYIGLNDDVQAGALDKAYKENSGGAVKYNSPTFESGSSASTSTDKASTEKVTKNVTYTSSKGNAVQYYGGSSAKWRSDNSPKVGTWGYGNHVAYWFFGDKFENIAGKDITKVRITFTRNSGGYSAATPHDFYVHNYETQPKTTSPSKGKQIIDGVEVATGSSKTIEIKDANLIDAIKKAKGICSYPPSQSKKYYSVMSGTMKVTFYYTE